MENKGNQLHIEAVDCQELLELVPAYCVNALDSDEQALIEAGLASCPELHTEIAAYKAMSERLLFSVPSMEPPPDLILKVLAASSRPAPQAQPKSTHPPVVPLFSRMPVRLLAGAAAILLVAFIGANIYWAGKVGNLENENENLTAQLQPNEESFPQPIANGIPQSLQLTSADVTTNGTLSWVPSLDNQRWVAWFVAREFTVLEEGQSYQLWLSRTGEEPLAVGAFSVGDNGSGAVLFEIDEPIESFNKVFITIISPDGATLQDEILSVDI